MKMLLLFLTQCSWKLLLHKCLIMHSNRRYLPAGMWMLLFICNYLLCKIETMLGRQRCLNCELFMDVSPWLLLPHMTFGCLSSSLHENLHFPKERSTTVYRCVQMHQDGCSEKYVHMFWDSRREKQEQHWFSSCYCSPSFSPEGSFGLGELWGRS